MKGWEIRMPEQEPLLYTELATWWPLLSPPSHYVEEAADLLPQMLEATDGPAQTLLELGCGGGSLAFHLKRSLQLTLTDRSPQMLAVSQATNPECEHLLGDMRSQRRYIRNNIRIPVTGSKWRCAC